MTRKSPTKEARLVKADSTEESSQVQVAKISLRQGVIVAIITSSLAAMGFIGVALINRPSDSSIEPEIQYLEENVKKTLEDLDRSGDELGKAEEEIRQKIQDERIPDKKSDLVRNRDVISEASKLNRSTRNKIGKLAEGIKEAKKKGKGITASMLYKEANEELDREQELRRSAKEAAEGSKLENKINPKASNVIATNTPKSEKKSNNIVDIDQDLDQGRSVWVWRRAQGPVLNGKAIYLPRPEYPAAARASAARGEVKVEVEVDEKGNVAFANAISGHPHLREISVKAALASKFHPTQTGGQPVRVKGIIVYNFLP